MNRTDTLFIVNPHSANGRAGKKWLAIETLASSMLEGFAVRHTERVGHASALAGAAVREGFRKIVCVGGDGTLNEIVNGLMEEDRPSPEGTCLGLIPFGTGCDFVRSFALPRDPQACLGIVEGSKTRPIDVGKASFLDHQGNASSRYFVNVTSFGLGGEVDARVNRTTRLFGGFVSFLYSTLASVLSYDKKCIRLVVDDQEAHEVIAWNVVVANGQYHGGGMWIAPQARLDDGTFDITVLGDFSLWEVFLHFPKLYTGRITTLGKVNVFKARSIRASSRQPVLLDVDGEQPGGLPVAITLIPKALRVLCP